MDFPIKEIIAGVVTLSVAGLGYRQWKRGRRSGRFIEDRETAYKDVWQALEDVHLLIRAGSFDALAVDAAVTREASPGLVSARVSLELPRKEAR